eukprot:Partr_v1_DN26782_c0_g1_i2_m8549 putative FANCD2 FANCI-associated nuclease 1
MGNLYDDILLRMFAAVKAAGGCRLISQEDDHVMASYFGLPDSPRFLLIRLYLRRDAWIRVSQLDSRYSDVDRLDLAVEKLVDRGLLLFNGLADDGLGAVLELLQLSELRAVCYRHSISNVSAGSKPALVDRLMRKVKSQRTIGGGSLGDIVKRDAIKAMGPVVRVSLVFRECVERVLVAYLCPHSWDDVSFTNDILSVTDRRRYPTYEIDHGLDGDGGLFGDHGRLSMYHQAIKLENDLVQCCLNKDWNSAYVVYEAVISSWDHYIAIVSCDVDCISWVTSYTAAHVYTRVLSQSLNVLAKLSKYGEEYRLLVLLIGQPFYCSRHRGRWWARLLLVTERYLQLVETFHDCSVETRRSLVVEYGRQALGDPFLTGSRKREIQTRLMRVSKALSADGEADVTTPPPSPPPQLSKVTIRGAKTATGALGRKSSWATVDDQLCSVEHVALDHYIAEGWHGIAAENSVFNTLFGLLFWDILFSPQPCVFVHAFQAAPLDLDTEFFYVNRMEIIDDRLKQLEDLNVAIDILTSVYVQEAPWQTVCVGVNWSLEFDMLVDIVKCLGTCRLVKLMRYFCQDHRSARSGLPDITLFRPATGAFKMVEVKGPGDSLQDNQLIWIDKFQELGIDVELCQVRSH